jgi:hypothetical protein
MDELVCAAGFSKIEQWIDQCDVFAVSLALVAAIYLYLDGESFARRADGSMPFAARCLLRKGLSR